MHMYTQLLQANLLTTLGTLGLLVALMTTPDNGKNQKLRLGYLLGFAFLSGLGLGPLLELVVSIDPSIVVTALVGKLASFILSVLKITYNLMKSVEFYKTNLGLNISIMYSILKIRCIKQSIQNASKFMPSNIIKSFLNVY